MNLQPALFEIEDAPRAAPLSRSEVARLNHRRAVDCARQRRHRDRKRGKPVAPQMSVTAPQMSVTAPQMSVTAPPLLREGDSMQLRFLLDALGRAARDPAPVCRASMIRHVGEVARENGVVLMDAGRFLDSAFESGLLPSGKVETCEVSRELLDLLIERGQL